jgi:hypothetical protein
LRVHEETNTVAPAYMEAMPRATGTVLYLVCKGTATSSGVKCTNESNRSEPMCTPIRKEADAARNWWKVIEVALDTRLPTTEVVPIKPQDTVAQSIR